MLPVEGHADLKGAEAHEERQESGLVQLKKRSYCYLQLLNGKEKKKTTNKQHKARLFSGVCRTRDRRQAKAGKKSNHIQGKFFLVEEVKHCKSCQKVMAF